MTRLHLDLDEAAHRALDLFIDRLRAGMTVDFAYSWVAHDLLDAAHATPVSDLSPVHATLDDGTAIRFEPDYVRLPLGVSVRHMLGIFTGLSDLPPPCTRGPEAAILTPAGTAAWTWPGTGGRLALLRGSNDGHPVLSTADGTHLYSPTDARFFRGGLLLASDHVEVRLDRDGIATVLDLSMEEWAA